MIQTLGKFSGSMIAGVGKRLFKEVLERPFSFLEIFTDRRKAIDYTMNWLFKHSHIPSNVRNDIIKGRYEKETWMKSLPPLFTITEI